LSAKKGRGIFEVTPKKIKQKKNQLGERNTRKHKNHQKKKTNKLNFLFSTTQTHHHHHHHHHHHTVETMQAMKQAVARVIETSMRFAEGKSNARYATAICYFSAFLGIILYVSTVFGVDHLFYNAFGIANDPHALRNGSVLFLATAMINMAYVRNERDVILYRLALSIDIMVFVHYFCETFVWHQLNWVTTAATAGMLFCIFSTKSNHD
jgi:hypothetical protein